MVKTQEVRRKFLDYFKKNQHVLIPSSSVVPHEDPSLLFINAGMNQFKDVFLGQSQRDYTRAATSQKCIRVGGKHNDLENVGHTSRHLTFFEMLGNFSFGDYFKKEAIRFAWEVSTEVFQLDPDRIWPTVFREDQEAFELWTHYVPAHKITRFDEKDNFWSMGDTGPCGPCSELLYDRGAHYGSSSKPSEDPTGERFLEYWNLVFMQLNREVTGVLYPLPKPSIDTGAGLERVLSLMTHKESVFETDTLCCLIAQIEGVTGYRYDQQETQSASAFRVIADHLRCLAFAIADGVQPSNSERGYVLRKVLRRAVRYGKILGQEAPFLAKILPKLVEEMGEAYPELIKSHAKIAEILTLEEESFMRTLKRGGTLLTQVIEQAQKEGQMITGEAAFKLKDTYGLPFEEVLLLAKDAQLSVDLTRYHKLEQEAKERSRQTQKANQQLAQQTIFKDFSLTQEACQFLGYDLTKSPAIIKGLVVEDELVSDMLAGQEGLILLNQTPFYAEMGGQVGDRGYIKGYITSDLDEEEPLFDVTETVAPCKGLIAHQGILKAGKLKVGDSIVAVVDQARRQKIANNHTATHLLHWALHHVLGAQVKQAGSVLDDQRLRFDFNHHKALTHQEIQQLEDLVNAKIRANQAVKTYELSFEEAQKQPDVKQFFGEKYGSTVRVVDIDYSKELCGGTHTAFTGNIGLFRIIKESSIAAGVRRLEAVTGQEAELTGRKTEELLNQTAMLLKTAPLKVTERLEKFLEENRVLLSELKQLKKQQLATLVTSLLNQIVLINQFPLLVVQLSFSLEELRLCAEELHSQHPHLVAVLMTSLDPKKCHILVRVGESLVNQGLKAQEIIKPLLPLIAGSGGGKAQSAQASGPQSANLAEILETVKLFLNHFILNYSSEKKC